MAPPPLPPPPPPPLPPPLPPATPATPAAPGPTAIVTNPQHAAAAAAAAAASVTPGLVPPGTATGPPAPPPPPPPPPPSQQQHQQQQQQQQQPASLSGPSMSHSREWLSLPPALAAELAARKEAVWLRIGLLRGAMLDRDGALKAFEHVLSYNPRNVQAMTQAGAALAKKEAYPQAVEFLKRAIHADPDCGEAWAVLAHCFVMTDELHQAYQAYQSALSHLPNPKDPNLWYGIGLLYDRYGSLENALEAFLAVLQISPDFERAEEVCFCIGTIYKEQGKFDLSLEFFNKAVSASTPPPPLTRADTWYQIGHVYELKKDTAAAIDTYYRALAENPSHSKSLQQVAWLQHQEGHSDEAINLLQRSTQADPSDGQSWYLLGRVYMSKKEFHMAYEAYQHAVYRDHSNSTFWCSIGVLYYQMQQYRDAMDAYSRAIRIDPGVSEVWYDLGTLYESCNQISDAVDAYRRAAELAPSNPQITQRLALLEQSLASGVPPPPANPSAAQQPDQFSHHQPSHAPTHAPVGVVSQLHSHKAPTPSTSFGQPMSAPHGLHLPQLPHSQPHPVHQPSSHQMQHSQGQPHTIHGPASISVMPGREGPASVQHQTISGPQHMPSQAQSQHPHSLMQHHSTPQTQQHVAAPHTAPPPPSSAFSRSTLTASIPQSRRSLGMTGQPAMHPSGQPPSHTLPQPPLAPQSHVVSHSQPIHSQSLLAQSNHVQSRHGHLQPTMHMAHPQQQSSPSQLPMQPRSLYQSQPPLPLPLPHHQQSQSQRQQHSPSQPLPQPVSSTPGALRPTSMQHPHGQSQPGYRQAPSPPQYSQPQQYQSSSVPFGSSQSLDGPEVSQQQSSHFSSSVIPPKSSDRPGLLHQIPRSQPVQPSTSLSSGLQHVQHHGQQLPPPQASQQPPQQQVSQAPQPLPHHQPMRLGWPSESDRLANPVSSQAQPHHARPSISSLHSFSDSPVPRTSSLPQLQADQHHLRPLDQSYPPSGSQELRQPMTHDQSSHHESATLPSSSQHSPRRARKSMSPRLNSAFTAASHPSHLPPIGSGGLGSTVASVSAGSSHVGISPPRSRAPGSSEQQSAAAPLLNERSRSHDSLSAAVQTGRSPSSAHASTPSHSVAPARGSEGLPVLPPLPKTLRALDLKPSYEDSSNDANPSIKNITSATHNGSRPPTMDDAMLPALPPLSRPPGDQSPDRGVLPSMAAEPPVRSAQTESDSGSGDSPTPASSSPRTGVEQKTGSVPSTAVSSLVHMPTASTPRRGVEEGRLDDKTEQEKDDVGSSSDSENVKRTPAAKGDRKDRMAEKRKEELADTEDEDEDEEEEEEDDDDEHETASASQQRRLPLSNVRSPESRKPLEDVVDHDDQSKAKDDLASSDSKIVRQPTHDASRDNPPRKRDRELRTYSPPNIRGRSEEGSSQGTNGRDRLPVEATSPKKSFRAREAESQSKSSSTPDSRSSSEKQSSEKPASEKATSSSHSLSKRETLSALKSPRSPRDEKSSEGVPKSLRSEVEDSEGAKHKKDTARSNEEYEGQREGESLIEQTQSRKSLDGSRIASQRSNGSEEMESNRSADRGRSSDFKASETLSVDRGPGGFHSISGQKEHSSTNKPEPVVASSFGCGAPATFSRPVSCGPLSMLGVMGSSTSKPPVSPEGISKSSMADDEAEGTRGIKRHRVEEPSVTSVAEASAPKKAMMSKMSLSSLSGGSTLPCLRSAPAPVVQPSTPSNTKTGGNTATGASTTSSGKDGSPGSPTVSRSNSEPRDRDNGSNNSRRGSGPDFFRSSAHRDDRGRSHSLRDKPRDYSDDDRNGSRRSHGSGSHWAHEHDRDWDRGRDRSRDRDRDRGRDRDRRDRDRSDLRDHRRDRSRDRR